MAGKKRVLIACDGEYWYVRRIKFVSHDLEEDEKVYRCDEPIGQRCASIDDAVQIAKDYVSS